MKNKLKWKGHHTSPRRVEYSAIQEMDYYTEGYSGQLDIKIARARQTPQERFSAIISELEGRSRIDSKRFKIDWTTLDLGKLPEDD